MERYDRNFLHWKRLKFTLRAFQRTIYLGKKPFYVGKNIGIRSTMWNSYCKHFCWRHLIVICFLFGLNYNGWLITLSLRQANLMNCNQQIAHIERFIHLNSQWDFISKYTKWNTVLYFLDKNNFVIKWSNCILELG